MVVFVTRVWASLLAILMMTSLMATVHAPASSAETLKVASSPTQAGGYWTVNGSGTVTGHSGSAWLGDLRGVHLNQPIVGIAPTPSGSGYWLVAADGGIFAFGDAGFFGSTGAIHLNKPIVGMAAAPDGRGYWLVASDGGIFAYGDAGFFGSTGAIQLNRPIVGMASTPSGNGYLLVASDGGIFAYGDAGFFGSTGAIRLNEPIVGMASTVSGDGYWLVAADGGIFAFGDAEFLGSNVVPGQAVYGITRDAENGYYVLQVNGTVIHFINSFSANAALPPPVTAAPIAPVPTTSTPTPPATPLTPAVPAGTDPLANRSFYVRPGNPASTQAAAWQTTRPQDAASMAHLGSNPTATWFGGWNTNITNDVSNYVGAAAGANALPVLVAYNIPSRDCGSFSAGGAAQASDYEAWIRNFAAGIANRPAVVIVEPDALPGLDCLDAAGQASRLTLLNDAVSVLSAQPNTSVYLDAGNSNWQSPAVMASRLQAAGVAQARGFSLNVSNFQSTSDSQAYGDQIAALTNSHFVIDTSRNGNGSNGDWCNPIGRAIGAAPTAATNDTANDAFLWIKVPGESDGQCNGGPSAGTYWADYALSLANNAGY